MHLSDVDFSRAERRRWDVTILRNVTKQEGIETVVVEQFHNVRAASFPFGIFHNGTLRFVDETGKEVVAESVPFIAKEVELAPPREK